MLALTMVEPKRLPCRFLAAIDLMHSAVLCVRACVRVCIYTLGPVLACCFGAPMKAPMDRTQKEESEVKNLEEVGKIVSTLQTLNPHLVINNMRLYI